MAKAPTADTGYCEVTLSGKFEDADHLYRPSEHRIVVDDGIYQKMKAAGVVESAKPAPAP